MTAGWTFHARALVRGRTGCLLSTSAPSVSIMAKTDLQELDKEEPDQLDQLNASHTLGPSDCSKYKGIVDRHMKRWPLASTTCNGTDSRESLVAPSASYGCTGCLPLAATTTPTWNGQGPAHVQRKALRRREAHFMVPKRRHFQLHGIMLLAVEAGVKNPTPASSGGASIFPETPRRAVMCGDPNSFSAAGATRHLLCTLARHRRYKNNYG